ncbi:MAG TPA: hypothetical protein VK978_04005 [Candidatus Saccharimonadales bacterium]|nr:hypothetical protein [Candidatus Saccharimonadales bacterium]
MIETERKFLVVNLPDVSGLPKLSYERYYLPSKIGEEIRIQKKGASYELEHKVMLSSLSRETKKETLSQSEYHNLKQQAGEGIERESYDLGNGLTVKIYKGRFSGLIRAEIEFTSGEAAASYLPETWFDKEITHTPLGKDKDLLQLSNEEFRGLLTKLSSHEA